LFGLNPRHPFPRPAVVPTALISDPTDEPALKMQHDPLEFAAVEMPKVVEPAAQSRIELICQLFNAQRFALPELHGSQFTAQALLRILDCCW
jgi:hypothetical protein